MATLKRLGLDENTLVVHAADQGWMGGQNGMGGMGDHFRPTAAHRDPQERFNLFGQPGTEGKRTELARRLDEFFAQYADPQYDIWKGGRSKARRHTE
jgi:hypothetical protein